MPESKLRKTASEKRRTAGRTELARKRSAAARLGGERGWVPYVFVPLMLLGVAWLVVYYIAGQRVPGMDVIGDWNIAIGMGLMAASMGVATLWK